jgi:beta-glucanase (GH16 family)
MTLVSSLKWLIPIFFLCAVSSTRVEAQPAPATLPGGYRLVWSDEFSQELDGLPNPKKWVYEKGLVRNHEAQYYTEARSENARIEQGHLVIEARKEPFPTDAAKAAYTSASITTEGKESWTYGRIEVRAKLPVGKGVWPAIWTLGSDIHQVGWPKCGEIDIMELVGKEPRIIHGTIHYYKSDASGSGHAAAGGTLEVPTSQSDFHVYAAEWTKDGIDLFVDDHKYFSFAVNKAEFDGENPFRKPHFLILNLAMSGEWGGPIDDSQLPQRMVVDYVRIYQKAEAAP